MMRSGLVVVVVAALLVAASTANGADCKNAVCPQNAIQLGTTCECREGYSLPKQQSFDAAFKCANGKWESTVEGTKCIKNPAPLVPGAFFPNVKSLPAGAYGFIQLLFLGAVYGIVLFTSSNMISDGSELLLLIPSIAGLVGSVVLPILGAVPDGMMVLFSGMGPKDQVQQTLAVGIGALAGSTIMLLTIPWVLSIMGGRVDIINGQRGNYKCPRGVDKSEWKKLSDSNRSLTSGKAGIETIVSRVKAAAIIMVITALPFLLIQGSAFKFDKAHESTSEQTNQEKYFAMVGFFVCVIMFIGYIFYSYKNSNSDSNQDLIDEVRQKAIQQSLVSLSGAFAEEFNKAHEGASAPLTNGESEKRFKRVVRTFFNRYDRDSNGHIDVHEFTSLLHDLGERLNDKEVEHLLASLDKDGDGQIDFDEFSAAMKTIVKQQTHSSQVRPGIGSIQGSVTESQVDLLSRVEQGEAHDDSDSDDEEEEEIPEDLVHLGPAEQRRAILKRSLALMGVGTLLVLLFADPAVNVINELGTRISISPFYVSFVLAPLASNASELIAAYNYAKKKTRKTITISLETLLGAGIMNNTFCLGIFLALIWIRGLSWEFSAETISIIAVEIAIVFFALKKVQTMRHAWFIATLYPLSLVLVIVLEKGLGLN